MPEPKDLAENNEFMGYSHESCTYFPCHSGVKREFNCLQCFCALYFLECPGPYKIYTDRYGVQRKDCSDCTLNHDGYEQSWKFINKWLENPRPWVPDHINKSKKDVIKDMKERTNL
jgi:Zn-finger protein